MFIVENLAEPYDLMAEEISEKKAINLFNQLLEVGFDAINVGNISLDFLKLENIIKNREINNQTQVWVNFNDKKEAEQAGKNKNISRAIYLFENDWEKLKEIKAIISNQKLAVLYSLDFSEKKSVSDFFEDLNQFLQLNISTIVIKDISKTNYDSSIFTDLFTKINTKFSAVDFFIQLNNRYSNVFEKIRILNELKIQSFYSNILGLSAYGGKIERFNLPTEKILTYLISNKIENNFDVLAFETVYNTIKDLFLK